MARRQRSGGQPANPFFQRFLEALGGIRSSPSLASTTTSDRRNVVVLADSLTGPCAETIAIVVAAATTAGQPSEVLALSERTVIPPETVDRVHQARTVVADARCLSGPLIFLLGHARGAGHPVLLLNATADLLDGDVTRLNFDGVAADARVEVTANCLRGISRNAR
jgi:hypothetical protein